MILREHRAVEYLIKRQERADVRARINELKSAPCTDCGRTFDPVCMDFDHRPGEIKLAAVSAITWAGIDRVLAEIAKCDLVCACCHRLRTKSRAGGAV